MDDVLLLLRIEHGNQSKLLDLLERQIDQVKRDRTINSEILQGIADYFLSYPDACHHPKEDAVFRRLCARDPTAAATVGDLLAEHESLAALTEQFAGVVRKMTLEGSAQADRFAAVAGRFVRALRGHMRSEEESFFPAIQRSLTAMDWAEIDFQIFDQEDPLFSREVENRFKALRHQILEADTDRQDSRGSRL